ncbi:MAG TPA: response regulator transcription factor [Actinoplanes sp.]|jgi:DNA-binding NarL/FixJ family response regulator
MAEAAQEVITVLVVDDHQTFAELLAIALQSEPGLSFVGHAQSSAEARELVERLRPDAVLMDVELPDVDGIRTTESLMNDHPALRVIVLTAHAEPLLVSRAVAAGACGFLPKGGALGDVLQALRTAHRGGMAIPAHLLSGALNPAAPRAAPTPAALLTGRERDVLQLIALGRDARAIANELGISLHTCRGHVKSILAKLDAHSQLEAVMKAIRTGLLDSPG